MITTDLIGRVERMRLSPRNSLLPLFEAVSNSIDAIRARGDTKGSIEVRLFRDTTNAPLALQADNADPITTIRVTDDGVGFIQENLTAFQSLDTRYKIASGGKGIGRLTWLKVFESTQVESIYKGKTGLRKRSFSFSLPEGLENLIDVAVDQQSARDVGTIVNMSRPKSSYLEAMRYRGERVAAESEKHFLYYLLESSPPEIRLVDNDRIFPLQTANVIERDNDDFTINNHLFTVDHLKVRSAERAQHTIIFCANHRPVREERLKRLPDRKFEDTTDGFFYRGYVSSPYLDSSVDEQRTILTLDEEPSLFGVSEKELRDHVDDSVDRFLQPELVALVEEKEKRIERVIEQNVPQLNYIRYHNRDELNAEVSFNDTDSKVESIISALHVRNQKTGRVLMNDLVEDLKSTVTFDLKRFQDAFEDRIKEITSPSEADLAAYILFRRSIIDLYREILQKSGNAFEKEAAVHKLMFPMGEELNTSRAFLNHNLWLLDERLTFADYIASDLPLNNHRILRSYRNLRR